jgi:hypothetical protein
VPWWASRRIAELEAFAAADTADRPDREDDGPVPFPDSGCSAATEGALAGALRRVSAVYRDGECDLSVEGVGGYRVGADGIAGSPAGAESMEAALLEALLGPALVLALAASRRFVLHASAVLVRERELIVFVGESGAGKSTLARHLGSRPGCRPVADDVLPVRWHEGVFEALPWFPQLKLGSGGQYAGGTMPERLRVARLFVVSLAPSTSAVDVTRLSGLDALAAMIRQTVSARLFSPTMLARNLRDLGDAVTSVPAYRLAVPRSLARLDEVGEVLDRVSEAEGASRGLR